MSAVLIHLNLTHTHARAPNPWAQRWVHRASSSSSTAMHTSIERDFIRWHSILQIFANQHQYAHCTLAIIFCDLHRDDAMMHAALFGSLLLRTVHTHTHTSQRIRNCLLYSFYIYPCWHFPVHSLSHWMMDRCEEKRKRNVLVHVSLFRCILWH